MKREILNKTKITTDGIQHAFRMFNAKSVLDITQFIHSDTVKQVREEVDRLIKLHSIRRDLTIPSTGHTPRRMNNVDFDTISEHSELLMQIYNDPELVSLLARIVGEKVHICPYDFEKMVITSLQSKGDSHGWHWDDYSFAMIWVLRAPEKEKGGVVQCVPNTRWDRENPSIISQFVTQPIETYYFPEGSVYLMRSNTTLHRVYPIIDASAERTILNNTYASTTDLSMEVDHSSMEQLFRKSESV